MHGRVEIREMTVFEKLGIRDEDIAEFKAWLARKGVDPIVDARIEASNGSLRNVCHEIRPGGCRMEMNASGEPYRIAWSSGLFVQEFARYRLVYRARD